MAKVWMPVEDGMYRGETPRDSAYEVDGAWLRTYCQGAAGWGCKIPAELGWKLCHLVDQPDAPAGAGMLTDEVREAIDEALSAWVVSLFIDEYNGYAKSADVDLVQQRSDKVRAWLAVQGAIDG
jgi:hypothetical protein